jgi:hypothetical protein
MLALPTLGICRVVENRTRKTTDKKRIQSPKPAPVTQRIIIAGFGEFYPRDEWVAALNGLIFKNISKGATPRPKSA